MYVITVLILVYHLFYYTKDSKGEKYTTTEDEISVKLEILVNLETKKEHPWP